VFVDLCLWLFRLQLAGKKFGHPAGTKKIESKKAKRNETKTMENLNGKIGNGEIAV